MFGLVEVRRSVGEGMPLWVHAEASRPPEGPVFRVFRTGEESSEGVETEKGRGERSRGGGKQREREGKEQEKEQEREREEGQQPPL